MWNWLVLWREEVTTHGEPRYKYKILSQLALIYPYYFIAFVLCV
jgi:hypothetical protein